MKAEHLAIVAAITLLAAPHARADLSYLDNGVIRLGVDLGKGGTITYLSTSIVISGLGAVNVINSHDLGREVQQSYRSGPDNLGGPNDSWNANAAGDGYGHPSPVLEHANDGKTIYTKTMPLLWGNLNNVSCECVTEQWIRLNGNSVQVHNRLTNNRSDHTQYFAHGAELPAAYTNGTFWRLITYNGSVPYTNAPLTELPPRLPGPDWSSFSATEHWAALVNDSGFGLGVFNSAVTSFLGGFAGDRVNVGGPSDDPTGYIAPVAGEIIDWNIVYEYDYALVLGTLDEIRAYAMAHRPDDHPDYRFARDRQHFGLFNATDAGWPVSGALRVNVDQIDPQLIGPEQGWQAGEVPYLYIKAAYHTSGTNAQVFWTVPGAGTAQERSVHFEAIPDGLYHTYAINVAASPNYQGMITGIRFDPTDGGDPNGYVDTAVISWQPPDLEDAQRQTAVEYYYADWNYYFVTSFSDEIAALDAGAYGGAWKRTGETFNVWSQPVGGALPTCRFFSTSFAPKSSHFYTPYAAECAALKDNPNWQYESIAFYLQLPDADGYCPAGTAILYRLYNNGIGGAPNHRFTTSIPTSYEMGRSGWIAEGDGRTGASACVPQ